MAVNNVFQMLAQQEIDRPERDLKRLQLKTLMDEAKYKEQSRLALSAPQQPNTSLQTLGSMGPEQAPFNPLAGPQMASMDPSAQGGTLAALGVNPMQRQEAKPPSLLDGFQRQYNYHKQQGREDYAQKVLQDQMEFTVKVADFADKIHKQQGPEGVAAWMKSNPEISSVLGDMSTIKTHKNGVWYPVTENETNKVIPGKYWSYDGKGGIQMHEDKPQPLQTIAPGYGVADGKGGFTVPVPTAPKNEYKDRTRPEGTGTVFEESQDGGKTWTVKSRGTKPASEGGMGKLDFESGKALVKGLPKLKEEAIAANGSIERIDTMLNLVKGGVGGKKGQLLSTLAPYAEMVGVNTKAMNEAQTYEIMAKTIGGSMRMQIVGPGPVSNYENQLLQKISGGGSAATPAATELLTYYRKMAKEKVDDYNGSVDAVSEFSPATRKIYRKVGSAAPTAPAGDKRPPLSAIFGTKKR